MLLTKVSDDEKIPKTDKVVAKSPNEIQFYEAYDKQISQAAADKEKADAIFYQRLEIKTQTATSTHDNRLKTIRDQTKKNLFEAINQVKADDSQKKPTWL